MTQRSAIEIQWHEALNEANRIKEQHLLTL
ncbi:hypothetical protein J2D73_18020 [Acetobacter sacchari]|uniref:Uncharacterized protein n=1 Tax=Acetobacter sacchari TaxID=2661687 RepID=A0ABS3M0M5_9PROT|nr:hypothetical protein [Acetobacter sacchari]